MDEAESESESEFVSERFSRFGSVLDSIVNHSCSEALLPTHHGATTRLTSFSSAELQQTDAKVTGQPYSSIIRAWSHHSH